MRRLVDAALGALVGAGLMLVTGAGARAGPAPHADGWRVVGVVVEDAAGQRLALPLAGLDAPTATPPPTNTPRLPSPTTSLPLPPYPPPPRK